MTDLFKTNNEYDAMMVGDEMYVAVPENRTGDYVIYKGTGREFNARFYSTGDRVDTVENFVTYVEDVRIHRAQLRQLGRTSNRANTKTPWGAADNVEIYGEGVMFYSTPSHGGFKVYKKLNGAIPEAYRNANGWYEEDCEWAKVAAGLPHLFTDRELRTAERTLKNWFPSAYEAVNNVVLFEEESYVKAETAFKERHAEDLIVIAAINSDEHEGMVKCTATVGGQRGGYVKGVEVPTPETRTFLVPASQYNKRSKFGFVIDVEQHRELVLDDVAAFAP